MSLLRPVGSTFEIENPPPPISSVEFLNRSWWETNTWRVKAHRKCMRFWGDKEGTLREEVELIETKKFHAILKLFPGNQTIWEKGENYE